jgi:hypothetical protein
VPEYFFSTSDTNETVTFMVKAPQHVAPLWNQLSVLPISAGSSLTALNTTQLSDTSPEEVTLSRLL